VSKGREIGTTLLVTPSILPDNTIRLAIDGTVSTIVGEVPVQSGGGGTTVTNNYPIVDEAHLVNLSRVPSGYSLILGGFVTIDNSTSTNKVPVLGSIPLLGQAFRFKSVTRSRTNLAFIITPIAFQAENPERAAGVSEHNRAEIIGPEHDLADPYLIGRTYDNRTDLRNSLSTGQFQESDKNPVTGRKQRKPKKRIPPEDPIPQTQSANPVDP
jgi:type II secretory pathway component GspD/PulD (secretin)